MGYRHYLGQMPKKKFEKLKSMTPSEIKKKFGVPEDEDYVGFYEIVKKQGRDIFEMGKWSEIGSELTYSGTPAFEGELADFFDEYGVTMVSREDLLKMITYYAKETESYFSDLLTKKDEYLTDLHLNQKISEWKLGKNGLPHALNLNLDSPKITDSFFYEYSLFELTRIYKTFDEKKDVLFVYGW